MDLIKFFCASLGVKVSLKTSEKDPRCLFLKNNNTSCSSFLFLFFFSFTILQSFVKKAKNYFGTKKKEKKRLQYNLFAFVRPSCGDISFS